MPVEIASIVDADPLAFGRAILHRRIWRKQRECSKAVALHPRVNIRSANGVGKTYWAGGAIVEAMLTHPGSRTICTGPSFEQVEAGLWQEVRRAFSTLVNPGGRMLDNSWEMRPGWDAAVINPRNISSAQGRRGQTVFVWIDEAQGVEDVNYWDALDSLCQGSTSRIVALGNPLWPQGRFFTNSSNPAWKNIRISGFQHPNVRHGSELIPGSITRQWIEQKKDEWGESDPKYIARVLGQFPAAGERQLIPLSLLEQCQSKRPDVVVKRSGGLDPARNPGSGDKNVLILLDESRTVFHRDSWWSDDTMASKGRAHDACRRFQVDPSNLGVDVVGIGAGIVDRFREDGIQVKAVNFGATPTGEWRSLLGQEALHANLKAELHDAMRAMFRKNLISVPDRPELRMLRSDLVELRYDHNGAGKMRMEDKDLHRKRCGRSPDDSDALVCALMPEGFVAPTLEELRRIRR